MARKEGKKKFVNYKNILSMKKRRREDDDDKKMRHQQWMNEWITKDEKLSNAV